MGCSKIMVVEDHPVSRKMLEAMLRRNYEVFCAASGQEAVHLASATRPDLVLLDIEMPGMDGFQTLEALRGGVIDAAVPVIFLTAREDSASKEQGLEAGAVDYITKPYDKHELSIKVKNHLALYEARKEIEAKNRIMEREMEMASQLQKALLPASFPADDRLEFAVVYKPVSEAGGDFYDLIELPHSWLAFAQVDVSGHGVASAMIGAMFKMVFHSVTRNDCTPSLVLEALNEELFSVLPDSDFLTLFYGIIHADSLDFIFSNAGHPRPFLYKKSDGTIEELSAGGPLLGAFPGMVYDEGRTRLNPGDRILVFTDGISEACKPGNDGEPYSVERLKRVFHQHIHRPPAENLQRIMLDLEEFAGETVFEDDVTMLLISVR